MLFLDQWKNGEVGGVMPFSGQIFDAVGWGNFDRPQGEPPGPTERRRRRKRERGEEEEEGEEEIM